MPVWMLSHVHLLATLWTVARQALLSMRFPRQEHWNELPFPPLGDLLHLGMKLVSPALAGRIFTIVPPGKPQKEPCCCC